MVCIGCAINICNVSTKKIGLYCGACPICHAPYTVGKPRESTLDVGDGVWARGKDGQEHEGTVTKRMIALGEDHTYSITLDTADATVLKNVPRENIRLRHRINDATSDALYRLDLEEALEMERVLNLLIALGLDTSDPQQVDIVSDIETHGPEHSKLWQILHDCLDDTKLPGGWFVSTETTRYVYARYWHGQSLVEYAHPFLNKYRREFERELKRIKDERTRKHEHEKYLKKMDALVHDARAFIQRMESWKPPP